MKTKEEIENALAHHSLNMKSLTEEIKIEIAKENGWSLDFLNGYSEGVKWAYEWVLKETE